MYRNHFLQNIPHPSPLLFLPLILFSLPIQPLAAAPEQSPALFNTIWNGSILYDNTKSSSFQKLAVVGRYHGQYWHVQSDGKTADGWENRRFFVGLNARFLQHFSIETQISISDDFDPVYEGLYDGFLQWTSGDKSQEVSIGRLDYIYTGLERSTSSKRLVTLERVPLVAQIMPGEVFGIYNKGEYGNWAYHAGLFSGSIEKEFTQFKGGFTVLGGISRKADLFYDKGIFHIDSLYNNGNTDNNAFEPYEHIISLWHHGSLGQFGMGVDITSARGLNTVSDLWGITLLPTWDAAFNILIPGDMLQLAFRYNYASSSDQYGLTFNDRYEEHISAGHGDSYNALYLGINYLIFRHRLKLMAGIEYFQMSNVRSENENGSFSTVDSIDGWSFFSGIRLYF